MRGLVSYAMPESCIHAPHFGWLLERCRAYPELILSIELKPSAAVMLDLMAGNIDFGFVNRAVDATSVQAYPFCQEEYVLVSATGSNVVGPTSLDELLALPMISYPGMIECLNRWTARHFGESDPIGAVALATHGQFNDIRGALAMVAGHLGVTVLPRHVAMAQMDSGTIQVLEVASADDAVSKARAMQQIWIVRLKERRMPARVKRVIRWFLEMHTELQPLPEEFLE